MLQILFLPALRCAGSGSTLFRAVRNRASRSLEVHRLAVAPRVPCASPPSTTEPTFGAAAGGEHVPAGRKFIPGAGRWSGAGKENAHQRAHQHPPRRLQNVTCNSHATPHRNPAALLVAALSACVARHIFPRAAPARKPSTG